MMDVSPLVIEIMIECYSSAEPGSGENMPLRLWNSPAGHDARMALEQNGLIDAKHKATERGKVWIYHLCDTPLPVQKWLPGERAA